MSEKVIGHLLLGLGIFVMLLSVGYVWLVFTSKIQPVSVIQAKSIKLDMAQVLAGSGNNPLSAISGFGKSNSANSSGGMELFSGQDLSKTINLSITFFLMSFVMLFGFRISSLGIMLMRPIVVKMKEVNEPTSQR